MNKVILLITVILMSACSSLTKHENLLDIQAQAGRAYAQGNYVRAQSLYEYLVKKTPEDADLRFRLGNAYARGHQADKAVLAYREAVVRNPRLHKAWNNMGTIQLRAAANSFTQLLQNINPDDPMYDQSLELVNSVLDTLKAKPLAFPESNADRLSEPFSP